jgi:hypothetical protein
VRLAPADGLLTLAMLRMITDTRAAVKQPVNPRISCSTLKRHPAIAPQVRHLEDASFLIQELSGRLPINKSRVRAELADAVD